MPDVLASLQASVQVNGERVTLVRGDEIPEGISDADRKRLEGRGSIVSPEELAAQAAERERHANAGAPEPEAQAAAEPSSDTPTIDVASASDEALAAWIKDNTVKVDELVAAANGNPEHAQRLLDAEEAATDGNPRKTAVKGLEAIIDAERE